MCNNKYGIICIQYTDWCIVMVTSMSYVSELVVRT